MLGLQQQAQRTGGFPTGQQNNSGGAMLADPAARGSGGGGGALGGAAVPATTRSRGAEDPSSQKKFVHQLTTRGFQLMYDETRQHPALFEQLPEGEYNESGESREEVLERKARALMATFYGWNHRAFPKLAMRATTASLAKCGKQQALAVQGWEKTQRIREERAAGTLDAERAIKLGDAQAAAEQQQLQRQEQEQEQQQEQPQGQNFEDEIDLDDLEEVVGGNSADQIAQQFEQFEPSEQQLRSGGGGGDDGEQERTEEEQGPVVPPNAAGDLGQQRLRQNPQEAEGEGIQEQEQQQQLQQPDELVVLGTLDAGDDEEEFADLAIED